MIFLALYISVRNYFPSMICADGANVGRIAIGCIEVLPLLPRPSDKLDLNMLNRQLATSNLGGHQSITV